MAKEEEGALAKLMKFAKTKEFVIFKCVVTIVLSIVSIVLASEAFNALDAVVGDITGILDNWGTPPVTEFTLTNATACPSGWEQYPDVKWRGLEAGACACPSGATSGGQTWTSSYTSCNSNQTSAGCQQDPALSSINMKYWRNRLICLRRESEAAYNRDDDYIRPRVSEPDSCPSGYVFCGGPGTTYANGFAHCARTDLGCPLTSYDILKPSDAAYSGFPSNYGGFFDGYGSTDNSEYDMLGRVGTDSYVESSVTRFDEALPVVDVAIGFAPPCITGPNQENYDSATSWSSSNNDVTNDPPSSCNEADPRYVEIDSLSEAEFMREHFLRESACAGISANNWANYDVYSSAGSSFDCRSASLGGGCLVSLSSGRSCTSTDSICTTRVRQSRCGQYHHVYDSGTDASERLKLTYRRQLLWQDDCPSYRDVADKEDPLTDLRDAQGALFTINTITNVIVMIVACLVIYNQVMGDVPCVPYEGEKEKKFIEDLQGKYSVVIKLIKFIPLIIAIVAVGKIARFFANKVEGCGDQWTQDAMDYLGRELPAVEQTNIQILIVDLLQLMLPLILIIFKKLFGKKEGEGDEKKPADEV
uniref:Uncharacterized protein n=1 Tax=Phaeomonas parva TaxID=124430 RepID=A0A7S1TP05_9STRA|mmetsp:Transcript_10472/g.31576  ORF Transcript_10472/g.31576 Transcript_10472/m.31576 type:complete len:589 (+) Transcript_10472:188-1954(+)